eukprot:11269469-Ditylum_brightwellii.AAC.1
MALSTTEEKVGVHIHSKINSQDMHNIHTVNETVNTQMQYNGMNAEHIQIPLETVLIFADDNGDSKPQNGNHCDK